MGGAKTIMRFMRSSRWRFSLGLTVALGGAVLGAAAARAGDAAEGEEARRPNVVVILADDLGYADLGVHGGKQIPTPNIDSIAKGGARFENGYVTCPFCAPTRAGLLTGRYGQRFGFETNPGPAERAAEQFGIPADVPTLAERLGAAGYATGMVGKWHMGYVEGRRPTERGFAQFFGFLGGGHSYVNGRLGILRGTEPVREDEYLTRAFGREAVAFIEKEKAGPFFLYLAFNAVHAPLHPDPDAGVAARVASISDPSRRRYASMLVSMDDAVGRVLGALEKAGVARDTLVFFLSDNGGPTPATTASNDPLRGRKGQVYEGGVRVPFFVRWPGRIAAGTVVTERVATSLDVVPTALAAAGVAVAPEMKLEGRDLAPIIAAAATQPATGEAPEDVVFWRLREKRAVRKGDWKLVILPDGGSELYNLAQDIGETKDVAAGNPKKVAELLAAWKAWDEANIAPSWGWGRRRARQGS
jgi:arylsulfatase A-like enzyme